MIGGLISASGISKPKQTLPFYSALLCGLCLIIISQTNSLYPALLLYAGIGFTAIISIVIFHHSTSHNSATLLNSSSAGTGQSLIHCISFTFHNERSVLSGICFLISGKRLSRRDLLSISSSL